MRCAIYARFSSERQNPRSIDDQVAVCRRHADRRGWEVVDVYTDASIAGFAMANRPGLLGALAAAHRGEFEILLAEEEDRFARNMGQLAGMRDELEYAGAVLATLETDEVELMRVAMKGFSAQSFLKNLGQKTARGLRSNAEKGLATGSSLYGYKSAPGGAMTIVPGEAAVVVRAYELYAAGLTGREIAARFNREKVPGPRGGQWTSASIVGSRQRANGVLRCELYAGVKVWDRMVVVKDPRTGKRRPRMKPREGWMRTEVPALAIVPAKLIAKVRARQARDALVRPEQLVRRPGVFSGLLKCGACGANYTVYNKGRLICAAHRERGDEACANGRTVSRAAVEARILDTLRTRLLAPEAVALYVRAYHQAWTEACADGALALAPIEQRRRDLKAKIDRLVDQLVDGPVSPALRTRLAQLEAELEDVERELQAVERITRSAPKVELHPRLAEAYAARIGRLQARLAEVSANPGTPQHQALIEAARGLVTKIEIRPLSADYAAPVELKLHGTLALFVFPGAASSTGEPRSGVSLLSGAALVAGGGYSRPPTDVPALLTARL